VPIIRLKDIRDLSPEERKKRATELQTELVRLRTMTKAGGSIENTARIKELRKTIARILTIDREAQLAAIKEAEQR
jgi:large subunit ribosomal protein L29